jgi:hypothetical protein
MSDVKRGRPRKSDGTIDASGIDAGNIPIDAGSVSIANGNDGGNTEPVTDIGGIPVIDHAGAGADAGADSDSGAGTRRKRGRPAGSTRAPKIKNSRDLSGLEQILLNIHSFAASITKTPELKLEQAEAQELLKAYDTLAQFYPNAVIDPKIMAWVNLFGVLGTVYGTRVFAIKLRRDSERHNRPNVLIANKSNVKPNGVDPINISPQTFDSRPPED